MPAYIELHTVGNGRAYVEAGSIGAVLTGEGCDVHTPGTKTKPVRVVLRNGETIDVIGDCAGGILVRAMDVRNGAKARKETHGDEFLIDFLKPMEAPDVP